jgi:hypothetical protein
LSETENRELLEALAETYRRIKGSRLPAFSIDFYPYSGLRHTVRLRDGRLRIRISDICREAPVEVLTALFGILISRLFRRKPSADALETYRCFVNRQEIREKTRQVRVQRSRKRLSSPHGKVFDLSRLFEALNARYFRNEIQVSRVGWSPRAGRHILGHFDPAHRTISLSRWLDHPLVPDYVVEYVLYHEMLHVWFDEETCGAKRRVHHRSFRDAERRFHNYQAARDFIRSNL